jgi:ferritin
MLTKKIMQALNGQINAEIYSAYLYYSMSAYFESVSLPGFSNWMKMQAQEEMFHATKFVDYVNERGGRVILEAIEKPPFAWDSALQVLEAVLKHEQKVTGLINALVDLANLEHDHASAIFLQWFVLEQVEEEAGVGVVLGKLKLINNDSSGMFSLDQEMGQRIFTPPPAK